MSKFIDPDLHALVHWVAGCIVLMERAKLLPLALPDIANAITEAASAGQSTQGSEPAEGIEHLMLDIISDIRARFSDIPNEGS